MSNNFRPSISPPNVPVPDPPGAKLLARIPIWLIGFGFLVYLVYSIYLEMVDRDFLRKPKPPAVSEMKPPPPDRDDFTSLREHYESLLLEEMVQEKPQNLLKETPLKPTSGD